MKKEKDLRKEKITRALKVHICLKRILYLGHCKGYSIAVSY